VFHSGSKSGLDLRESAMKVYLSSTYLDLKRHRKAVGIALRKAQYDVVMMEEYAARDLTVEFACQGDVADCEAYVGVFAWRYGHIPEDNNPGGRSITELEYAAAAAYRIPCLVFLLKDDARWPKKLKDADLARIKVLRATLNKSCAAHFSGAQELAVEVLAALRVLESKRRAQQLEAVVGIQNGEAFGASGLANIRDKWRALRETALIEIQIGPTTHWCNTRHQLIAALAEEFGATEFVFVEADKRFLIMASPTEIRRRLAQRWPTLEQLYTLFRKYSPTLDSLEYELGRFPEAAYKLFGKQEADAKEVVTSIDLRRELGVVGDAETVDTADKGQVFLQREILGRSTPFVALVRDGRLEGIIDKGDLARRVAIKALGGLI
jgi:hypothetical protein